MSPRLVSIPAVLAALLSAQATAQSLAGRIAALRDGSATLTYAARPDVCGDGHTIILRSIEQRGEIVIFSDEGKLAQSWKPCMRPFASPCGIS